ncbi:MAG: polymer-forming cytoskeletal protein [Candidatus Aenigmarchaeota archaeon]|nr:polymer-forming cytoskeletal protein [Candidatus Aenigmarchaeota archaeon]
MKKMISIVMILLLFIPIVSALEIKEGDEVIIEDRLYESLYVAAGSISVDAPVDGDITAFGGSISINNPVKDDLMACGGQVSINAPVGKTAHVCGGAISINSEIGGDLTIGGGSITINSDVDGDLRVMGGNLIINGGISGDILAAAGNIVINGPVSGDLAITAEELTIKGIIDGDVNANAEKITLGKDAVIKGDFKYTDKNVLFNEEQVKGSIIKKEVETKTPTLVNQFGWIIFGGLALLLVGILLVLIAPKSSDKLADNIKNEFLKSMLYGLITLVVFPVIALLLAITVIGIPISIMMILLYIVTIYLSKVFVGLFLGRLILKNENIVWATILGLVIYLVLANIPVIGGLVTFLTVLLGLGTITIWITTKKETENKTKKSKIEKGE